jgi:hypothetical protein
VGTTWFCSAAVILLFSLARPGVAQELEPRRWSHLPIDTNFATVGYAYTNGDIAFDPVLAIEGASMEMHTGAAGYIRTFELFARSARIDVIQGFRNGLWSGLLDGVPTSISRTGWVDTVGRFAINLYGAPPLQEDAYAAYRAVTVVETLIGIALTVQLPTGDYMSDRLINLGNNRYMVRPELGVMHNRGRWSFEVTAGVALFTDNDEFFNGNRLEQDPMFGLQGHIIYTFRPGLWAAISGGYERGSMSKVNGVTKDDRKQTLLFSASVGYSITPEWGVKLVYVGTRKSGLIGIDADSVAFGISTFW